MPRIDRRGFLAIAGAALVSCTKARHETPAPPAPLPTEPSPSTVAGASHRGSGPSPGAPARYVAAGPPDSQAVALTFHASGDLALASRLLDLLRDHGVHTTVFVVGKWLEANPAIAARLTSDGHQLGNHTYSHQAMGRLNPTQTAGEIRRAADVLRRETGTISRWFRPSGIAVPTPVILAEAGRAGYPTSVGYSVDSLDFQDPGAAAVRRNVARGAASGAIVSLHFGHQGTIEALPGILDDLARGALRPVTVAELLS